MKPQVPVWVALTFLMLLLVLFAALIFMFQGRYALEDRIGALQEQATESAESITSLQQDTTAEAVALADAEATVAAMQASAEVAQGQIDELNAAVLQSEADATTAIQRALDDTTAARDAATDAAPIVNLSGLVDGGIFEPNSDVELVLSASAPLGVVSILLTVNGEEYATLAGADEVLIAEIVVWNSAEEGTFTFEASALDTEGVRSTPLVLTVEVIDREARLQTLVTEIQAEIEEIRGLEFTDSVTLTLYTQAELRENFEEVFGEDLSEEEARLDVLELYAFDFVEPDYDLYNELVDLYSGSVLGFYDPDTSELVVVSDDGELSLSQRLTLVHELNHALQDQVFGLDLGDGEDEENFAFRAFVEGESSLMETLYITQGYMTDAEVAQLFEEFENSEAPDRSTFPDVIVNGQLFPYINGAEFVRDLYIDGQFERLNEIWNAPPTTSEQVMHIELFESGEGPKVVSVPVLTDTLGAGWEFVVEDVLGEFFVSEYLDVQLEESNSDRAAAGWGGDRYVIHWNEATQEVVLLLVTEWDNSAENNQFANAYINYATRKYDVDGASQEDGSLCWQGADITCLYQSDSGSTIIRAPSRELVIELFALTQ